MSASCAELAGAWRELGCPFGVPEAAFSRPNLLLVCRCLQWLLPRRVPCQLQLLHRASRLV